MKSFSLLNSALFFFCIINACVAVDDRVKALEVQSAMRRELGLTHYILTHFSINSAAPKPPKPPKKPTSSSSSSSNSSSSTYSTTGSPTSNPNITKGVKPNKYAAKISVGVAAAGAVIAAASFHQRRKVATEVIHPLAGSIAKRVENFEKFAGPHAQNVRPTLDYNAMPDTAVMFQWRFYRNSYYFPVPFARGLNQGTASISLVYPDIIHNVQLVFVPYSTISHSEKVIPYFMPMHANSAPSD
eukprot:scaffold1007_cov183-Chaetoceros_neogracile.AAC.5